jgi:hypothetical protein
LKFCFSILFFIFNLSAYAAEPKNRVEELFIWKISDEMKLSVPEEKAFSDLIRALNQKRHAANESLQNTLKKMSDAKSLKEKEKLLSDHRKHLKTYNDLSVEEADRIEKLFGAEKATQYFVLKNDLTNRLKSMLAAPEKPAPSAEKLAPPKLIEEK